MSRKALGKMNKAELLEFAKEMKDGRKAFIFKIDTLDKQYSDTLIENSILRDKLRICRDEKKILQKNIKVYAAQKKLMAEEVTPKIGKAVIKKDGFWKTFFKYLRTL